MMRFIATCCFFSVIFHHGKPNGPVPNCPCASKAYCNPATDWSDSKTEVMVVTNRTTDYKKWLWNTFTTVIEWNSNTDTNMSTEIMCYAHSQGKKYGIYVNDFPTDVNETSAYISETANIISYKRADVVIINLVDYLGDCHYASFHVDNMINLTTTVLGGIKELQKTVKLLCLMPWKPPCYEANCDLGPALAKQCDGVVFSPESYNTYCSETCTAKPTVSYSKIDIGISEYTASGFNRSQLILGIPWHGYNYTCNNDDKADKWSGNFVCHLKTKKVNTTDGIKQICDVEGSRQRKSVGSEIGKVPEMALLDSTYMEVDQAPFKLDTVETGDTVQKYMTWFEDIGSLMAKYEAVGKFKIKGCVIFTADDLSYTKMMTNKEFDDHMWAWMLHSIFSNGTTERQEPNMNVAGTVAGVGVGMFLLGFVLGALILCIVFRRQKRLRPPFSRDTFADEFKDDDDHNQL